MTSTTLIELAQQAKDAIVHGIDANGNVVAAGVTPAYGGTTGSEDFVSNEGGFNVYCFQIDGWDEVQVPMLPAVLINLSRTVASEKVFGDEPEGVAIEWQFQVNDFKGTVTVSTVTYRNEQACMVWLDRLMEVLKRLNFPMVEVLNYTDAEPVEPGKAEGEDDFLYFSGGTLYFEYVKEI